MTFEILNQDNVEAYIAYLKTAMREEPDKMMVEVINESEIRSRISDPFFNGTTSLLAIRDGKVVGRIEYHFYGCMQDGYKMAYVDWVYVLAAYRHKGIARKLFQELERDCMHHKIDQYFLICAENDEADRFYKSFHGVERNAVPVLRKTLTALSDEKTQADSFDSLADDKISTAACFGAAGHYPGGSEAECAEAVRRTAAAGGHCPRSGQ